MCPPLEDRKDTTGEGDKYAAIRLQEEPSRAAEHEQLGCQKEPHAAATHG